MTESYTTLQAGPTVLTVAVVAIAAGTAAVIDLRTRRIPNALTMGTAIVGLSLAVAGITGISMMSSALGGLLGLLLMMPGRVLGATGAGDVKLVAALGTLLGTERIVAAFLLTAIAGGVLALGYALHRGRARTTVRTTARLLRAPWTTRRLIQSPESNNRFPYGPAIAIGGMLALVL